MQTGTAGRGEVPLFKPVKDNCDAAQSGETCSLSFGGYCYAFFHHKHVVGIAYALILAARLCRLWVDDVAGSALWWLDTSLLLWVALLLNAFSGKRTGRLGYAKLAVVSLTAFHVTDLVTYLIIAAGRHHMSWQHIVVTVLFTVFSVGPTVFLLWCDTHHYVPAARLLHAVTGVRVVILLAEAALYISEILQQDPARRPPLIAAAALTIAGHVLYEVALGALVHRIHLLESIEKRGPRPQRRAG